MANILPPSVTGMRSPYPIVRTVVIVIQMASKRSIFSKYEKPNTAVSSSIKRNTGGSKVLINLCT